MQPLKKLRGTSQELLATKLKCPQITGELFYPNFFAEIEGRLTKKLFQEHSRTESCILGAFSRLDDFLLNPVIQGYSGTAPVTYRKTLRKNQGTKVDDSQSDPRPEAGISQSQTENSGPDDTFDRFNQTPVYLRKVLEILILYFTERNDFIFFCILKVLVELKVYKRALEYFHYKCIGRFRQKQVFGNNPSPKQKT